jgi:hypothetical protein
MKTTKTISKKGKTEKMEKTPANKKVNVRKEWPGEEEIREKAMEIYNQRIERGEHGNAESDWLEAERLLLNK